MSSKKSVNISQKLKELEEENAILKSVVRKFPDAVIYTDDDGNRIFVSKQAINKATKIHFMRSPDANKVVVRPFATIKRQNGKSINVNCEEYYPLSFSEIIELLNSSGATSISQLPKHIIRRLNLSPQKKKESITETIPNNVEKISQNEDTIDISMLDSISSDIQISESINLSEKDLH